MRKLLPLAVLLLSANVLADATVPPAGKQPDGGAAGGSAKPYLMAGIARTGCLGPCPSYSLRVFSDGKVEYEGQFFVKVRGKAGGTITPEELAQLRQAFAEAKYFSLGAGYDCYEWSDNPSVTTFFYDGQRRKTIDHYHGCRERPNAKKLAALNALEDRVDQITRSERWVGTPEERRKIGVGAE